MSFPALRVVSSDGYRLCQVLSFGISSFRSQDFGTIVALSVLRCIGAMSGAATLAAPMEEVLHLVPELQAIYRAEGELKPRRVALFLGARGITCSRRTIRGLCARAVAVERDAGGGSPQAGLSSVGVDEVQELLPLLRAVYVAEGGIGPKRVALFLRERGLEASRHTLRRLCERAAQRESLSEVSQHVTDLRAVYVEAWAFRRRSQIYISRSRA